MDRGGPIAASRPKTPVIKRCEAQVSPSGEPWSTRPRAPRPQSRHPACQATPDRAVLRRSQRPATTKRLRRSVAAGRSGRGRNKSGGADRVDSPRPDAARPGGGGRKPATPRFVDAGLPLIDVDVDGTALL